MKWARNKGIPQAQVELFFEDGAKHHGQLERILRANDGIGPIFKTKEEMVQFQAADLLAWKSHKVLQKVIEHDGSEDIDAFNSIRRSLEEVNSIPHSYGVHTYESLKPLIQRAKVPLRSMKQALR